MKKRKQSVLISELTKKILEEKLKELREKRRKIGEEFNKKETRR